MAIYGISDLHLSFQTQKPMNKFGARWDHYEHRLRDAWNQKVAPQDLVLIPGDVSWATYLDEAVEDFRFIDGLNGRKLISKGNHDYWWETLTKLERFADEQGFTTIRFLHNNCFVYQDHVVCGAKGYDFTVEERLRARELIRLELSLQQGEKTGKAMMAMLHYPPVDKEGRPLEEIEALLRRYQVRDCVYGHLHGAGHRYAFNEASGGIHYRLLSCDYLEFVPILIAE